MRQLTFGYLSTGTKIFSVRVTVGPLGSGRSRGFLSVALHKRFFTLLISGTNTNILTSHLDHKKIEKTVQNAQKNEIIKNIFFLHCSDSRSS